MQTVLLLYSAFPCIFRFFGLSPLDTVTTLMLSHLASFLPFPEVIPAFFHRFVASELPEKVARLFLAFIFIDPPGWGECRLLQPHSVLRLLPTSFQVRAFLAEVARYSTSAKNRCGCRVDRLRPPSALRFTPPPLLCRGLARSIPPTVTNYL